MRAASSFARAATVAFVLAVMLAASAAAQSSQPVLVEDTAPLDVSVTRDETPVFTFTLLNLNSRVAFWVNVDADDFPGWTAAVAPNKFFLDPREERNLTITLAPHDPPPEFTEGDIVISLVNSDTGNVFEVTRTATVHVTDGGLVLGVFDNPLPPPLDNAWGVFMLDIAFWALVGVGSFLTGDTVVRYLTRFARVEVTRVIIRKLRWPVFWFVLLLGLRQSIDVLPPSPVTIWTGRFLSVIALAFIGVYVAYRILDAALFYYGAEIAPRTASRVDDVLLPAIRKLMSVVLVIIAIGITMGVFGWNPSVLFGAAGIVGLAIAFAAQETVSNLISGVFIMLDRPFAEGEDIQLTGGEVVRVEKVGLRSTRLYHYRHHEHIIQPNRDLANGRIINLTRPDRKYKMNLEVGVSYGTDVTQMRDIALRVARETPGVFAGEDPVVIFTAFGQSSLDFIVRYTVEDYTMRFAVTSDMRQRLLEAFRAADIEIPFPQRVLHLETVMDGGVPVAR